MKVTNRCEEIRHVTEIFVDINLLEISLGQAFRVFFVRRVRAHENFLSFSRNLFPLDDWPLPVILREAKFVVPCRGIFIDADANLDHNIRVAAGCQAAQSGNASPLAHALLETTSHSYDIVKKAKDIE